MARRRTHAPLRVLLNNRLVGRLSKSSTGAIDFQYDAHWLEWEHALPVSLSLPLREDAYRGEVVGAVFENLLPDSDVLRRLVAERVGAAGTDFYSLLAAIGRDCVGALQFTGIDDADEGDTATIKGETITDTAIEKLLRGLSQAPLGLSRDEAFRISVAGAQEKPHCCGIKAGGGSRQVLHRPRISSRNRLGVYPTASTYRTVSRTSFTA